MDENDKTVAAPPRRKITIDGKEYGLDDLSEAARAQVQSLQFVEAELARANALVAVLTTARGSYLRALREELGEPAPA